MESKTRVKIDVCLECAKPENSCERCHNNIREIKKKVTSSHGAEVVRLHALGLVDKQIAAHIGISQPVVCVMRNRLGLPPNGKPYKRVDYRIVAMLYKKGYNDQEIARKVNCKGQTVMNWRHNNNLQKNDNRGRNKDE